MGRSPWLQKARAELAVAACVAIVAGAVLAGFALAGSQPQPMTVHVDGGAVRLADQHPTVAAALRQAHVPLRDGSLFAVVSHRRLDPHAFPARLFVDGRLARPTTVLGENAKVVVIPGHDELEPVERRQVPLPSPGLPPVENHLWRTGPPGVDDVEAGRVSGEVVRRFGRREPGPAAEETGMVVALTFDDGPDPQWTPQVLQILQQEGVKATFCLIGYLAARHPDLVRAEAGMGHAICDHTMHHPLHLERRPHRDIVDEIGAGADAIRAALGSDPLLYRPPGGTLSPEVIDVAHQRGLRVLRWTVDPADYRRPPAPVIMGRVLGGVSPGAVVLMHDGGGDRSQTIAMLPELIHQLKARGFTFGTPLG